MYAFIDETGAFGFNFKQEGCSQYFIICAVIVKESDLPTLTAEVERIRARHFQTGEMKSSKVGRKHSRRQRILEELKMLPYNIYVFVCDKKQIGEQHGLRFKKTFYKFLNNIVYQELQIAFPRLTIVADGVGGNEFQKSFKEYMSKKEVSPINLFGEGYRDIEDSKEKVLIQLADFIVGCISFDYEPDKISHTTDSCNYRSILDKKILLLRTYPESFVSYTPPEQTLDCNYDHTIAEISYRQAVAFREKHKETNDEFVQRQIVVLDYLLFRFMNLSLRHYIPTKELQQQLRFRGFDEISTQIFRTKIIARLRDEKVIISSSKGGYKLPSTRQELVDFISLGKNIVTPLLSRLHACHDTVKLGTNGELDLFELFHFIEDINKAIGNY